MKIENNNILVYGEIVENFKENHEVFGEKFYSSTIKASRDSGNFDLIPILVSEKIIDVHSDWIGVLVKLEGQIRTYNKKEDKETHLIISVFVHEFSVRDESNFKLTDNKVRLTGTICKKPVYRMTPLGREIADVLLAVNRPYGKSDYIPCICCGRNARYADQIEVGNRISLSGRMQSREYQKKISEEEFEKRTAYEVSVSLLERLEDEA